MGCPRGPEGTKGLRKMFVAMGSQGDRELRCVVACDGVPCGGRVRVATYCYMRWVTRVPRGTRASQNASCIIATTLSIRFFYNLHTLPLEEGQKHREVSMQVSILVKITIFLSMLLFRTKFLLFSTISRNTQVKHFMQGKRFIFQNAD